MNKNGGCALNGMRDKRAATDDNGPMRVQPIELGPTAPTQMLPMMPGTQSEPKAQAEPVTPDARPRTRTEAVRGALARITRRKSLRKQREAQKS